MLADRFILRRKLREMNDLKKVTDEKSVAKVQRLLAEITQKLKISEHK